MDFIDIVNCQVLGGEFQRGEISNFPLVVDMESRPVCLCCHRLCVGVQDGVTLGFDINSSFREHLSDCEVRGHIPLLTLLGSC